MRTVQFFSRNQSTFGGLRILLISLISTLALGVSSAAFGQTQTQAQYPAADAGDWSNGATVTGPPDGACRGLGNIGSENFVNDFGFDLPSDAVIIGLTAYVQAVSQSQENVQIELATDVTNLPASIISDPQTLDVRAAGSGNCASSSEETVGTALAFWGIGAELADADTTVDTSNFGILFTTLENSSVKIDSVCMTIDYTTATGPDSQEACFDPDPVLTLRKTVTLDNGGTALDTAFTLTATGPTPITGVEDDLSITAASVLPGVYTLTESSVPGYSSSIPAINCIGGGALISNSLTLVEGEIVECTFFNDDDAPSLTLVKQVTNDSGGTAEAGDWTLTATGYSPGDPQVGTYDLSETGPANYSLTSLTCDNAAGQVASVTLGLGEDVTCTFVNNDDAPSLTLVKQVTNDSGGTAEAGDWTLTATGYNPGDPQAGTYDLSESGPANYSLTSLTCDNAAGQVASVTLGLGEDVTCTFVNNDDAASLTLVKQVINDNGGTAVFGNWTLSANGPGASDISGPGGATSSDLDAGAYDLSESVGPVGYTASAWVCVGGTQNDGDTVTLALGESSTCTIINDDDAASLTISKTIQSDNGGTATLDDFDVFVDGFEVDWDDPTSTLGGSKFHTDNAGTYTLSEGTVDGYTPGVWSCSGVVVPTNGGAFDGADVTVALGQTITCSITNEDDETALMITKVIESDNGGTATLGDFDVSVNMVEVDWSSPDATDSGMETVATVTGTYNLSEIDFAGYTEGTWSCSDSESVVPVDDGSFGDSDVTVELGQTVTCTIINTDDPATLTLVKEVTNDNGGDEIATSWNVAADGPDDNDFNGDGSASSSSLDIGAYDLSESGVPLGYTASAWVCTGDGTQDDDDTITLGLGDVATCTITNDDVAPILTIIKTVVNNSGGTAVAGNWNMDVTATNPSATGFAGVASPGVDITIDANADYSVDESGGPSGYQKTLGDGCDGNLSPGGLATCTITNDDIPAILTLVKEVDNGFGGEAVAEDWHLEAIGPDTISGYGGVGPLDVDAGAYSLSESNDFGDIVAGGIYVASEWNCTGDGEQNGSSITLGVAEEAVCTITNTFVPVEPVPVNNPLALLLMTLLMLATGWYFRPEQLRKL